MEVPIDGERIRLIRDRLGLTQQQLAQMLGVHPVTLSRWERNQAEPGPYNVQQLLLLEEGAGRMGDDDRQRFMAMIATGLFVGALAFVVGLAVRDFGQRRGWW